MVNKRREKKYFLLFQPVVFAYRSESIDPDCMEGIFLAKFSN